MNSEDIFLLDRSRIVGCNAEVISNDRYEPVLCSADPSHNRMRRIQGPITIDAEESDSTDCLWSPMSDCLLNEAIIDEFISSGFTGFSTDEVTMTGHSRLGIQYARFWPIGWGGVARIESGIDLIYRCESCLRMRYSALSNPNKLFDPTQWDGSDVFMIWPMPMFIFVSRRMADLVKRLNVTGVELVPLTEMAIGVQGFGPARLSTYLPQERANRIGKPFGID